MADRRQGRHDHQDRAGSEFLVARQDGAAIAPIAACTWPPRALRCVTLREVAGRGPGNSAGPSQADLVHHVHADATGARLSCQPENRLAAALSARTDAAHQGRRRERRGAAGDAPDQLARRIRLVSRNLSRFRTSTVVDLSQPARNDGGRQGRLAFSQGSALIVHRNSGLFGGRIMSCIARAETARISLATSSRLLHTIIGAASLAACAQSPAGRQKADLAPTTKADRDGASRTGWRR